MLDITGAVAATWPDEGVAAHYGDPLREQRVMATEGALVDRSNRGIVTVTGPDRLSWLHSLTSQHLERLRPGDSAQALILSPQGHIEHHLTLTDDGTSTWIHVEPLTAPALAGYLDSMRFMLRVEVQDVTWRYALVTLAGPLPPARVAEGPSALGAVARMAGALGTDVVIERDQVARAAASPPMAVAGMWAFEAARIAAHIPRPGVDTDQRTLPHEVALIEAAVDLNKGCYRGQETVARVHNLGHPPRRLVFLHLDGSVDRLPARGAPIAVADPASPGGQPPADPRDAVGFVGSAALHYELGPIGLGLVKRNVPVEATLLADGVAATQEVIVSPEAGANVTVTLRRDSVPQPPAAARRLK